MATAGDNRNRSRLHRARSKRFAPAFLHPERLVGVTIAHVDVPPHGHADHPEHRFAVFDQRDVDRELAVAADELLGAVERVDQPVALPVPTLFERWRLGFLGNHRHIGRQLVEAFHDDAMGA